MFTDEFDRLDRMLVVAGINHDMRYGRSEIANSNRLFYILNVDNRLEVRLLDNERNKGEERPGLELQESIGSGKRLAYNSTAEKVMSKIVAYMYTGENNNENE